MRPEFTAKCQRCGKIIHYFLIEMTNKKTGVVLNVCAECANELLREG